MAPVPPTPPARNVPAAVLGGIGGLIMMFNGIQTIRGHGNNLLFLLGFGLMIAGMGLRGQLTKKL